MQTVQSPTPPRKTRGRRSPKKLLSTRGGTALTAAITAVLAAAILMVFLERYRDSVNGSKETATVLVAKRLIEKGSPGDVVAEAGSFQTTTMPKSKLKDGALADPSSLSGKVAAVDVYPGEQLVTREFVAATPSVFNRLSGYNRAIAVPLDESHGLIGTVRSGDHVDVFAGVGIENANGNGGGRQDRATLRAIMRDALVLKAPDKPKGSGAAGASNVVQPVILRAPDDKAAELAFASDTGKVWIVARPKVGAKDSKSRTVDVRSLVLGGVTRAIQRGLGEQR